MLIDDLPRLLVYLRGSQHLQLSFLPLPPKLLHLLLLETVVHVQPLHRPGRAQRRFHLPLRVLVSSALLQSVLLEGHVVLSQLLLQLRWGESLVHNFLGDRLLDLLRLE